MIVESMSDTMAEATTKLAWCEAHCKLWRIGHSQNLGSYVSVAPSIHEPKSPGYKAWFSQDNYHLADFQTSLATYLDRIHYSSCNRV